MAKVNHNHLNQYKQLIEEEFRTPLNEAYQERQKATTKAKDMIENESGITRLYDKIKKECIKIDTLMDRVYELHGVRNQKMSIFHYIPKPVLSGTVVSKKANEMCPVHDRLLAAKHQAIKSLMLCGESAEIKKIFEEIPKMIKEAMGK